MKKLIFLLLFFSTLHLSSQTIEQLRTAYENNTLRYNDIMLTLSPNDSSSLIAAKNYFKAVLYTNFEQVLQLHTSNFYNYPNEIYGIMSGLQLISIDFINHDYNNAFEKLEKINTNSLPEVQYYKIKINQAILKFDVAISLGQDFINQHQGHNLIPYVWLIILESYYKKTDLQAFERNYRTFSCYREFDNYKPYLLYLNAYLLEESNLSRARTLYSQIINEFPNTQYRVQAEDRLFTLRLNADRSVPTTQTQPAQTPGTVVNTQVNRYEELTKNLFYIQFGVFSTESAARNYVNTLNRDNVQSFTISKPVGGRRLFAVIQGPYQTMEAAQLNQRNYNTRNHQTFIFKAE